MPKENGKKNETIEPAETSTLNRRDLIRSAGALAAAGLSGTVLAAEAQSKKQPIKAPPFQTRIFPKYYPQPDFTPEISLAGKFAVITGASRGIGRATAEALVAQGVTVVGTSRNSATVPNPPATFTLMDLDITSDASVNAFASALAGMLGGGTIDILLNNAGRLILGTPVPPPIAPNPNQYYIDQLKIGIETIYEGHIRVTNKLLPMMTKIGYSRLLYTVSVAGYLVGGGAGGAAQGNWVLQAYNSGKGALRTYANNLRGFLDVSGSNIRVSTVNPFFIRTTLADGLNPVYTEPVDANGNSPFNPVLQSVLNGFRYLQNNALPVSFVADTYVQLLSVAKPESNVAVGSSDEPFASKGGNAIIIGSALEESETSVLQYGCAPPGQS
jgi:NAD(P)-dependent dehydrogenase (short-subunit alcohol dehydrogenase family)